MFVSEYEMPSGGFVSIWEKEKLSLFKKTKSNEYHIRNEHLFVQSRFADIFGGKVVSFGGNRAEQMEFVF